MNRTYVYNCVGRFRKLQFCMKHLKLAFSSGIQSSNTLFSLRLVAKYILSNIECICLYLPNTKDIHVETWGRVTVGVLNFSVLNWKRFAFSIFHRHLGGRELAMLFHKDPCFPHTFYNIAAGDMTIKSEDINGHGVDQGLRPQPAFLNNRLQRNAVKTLHATSCICIFERVDQNCIETRNRKGIICF